MKRVFCEKLGLVIGLFGEVEFITYRMWSTLGMRSDPPISFKSRVDKLLGQLKDIDPESEILQSLLIEAKNLYDIRNDIAHNPIWSHDDGYVIFVEGKEKPLSLEQLMDIYKKMSQLLNELWKQSKYFSGEHNWK